MKLRVYYLDDERDLLEAFVDTFSSDEIQITTFENPQLAIDAARDNPPDVFFIDMRLPRTTGDVVAQQMDPNLPKILITGDIHVTCKSEFLKIYHKPFQISEVEKLISDFLETKRSA